MVRKTELFLVINDGSSDNTTTIINSLKQTPDKFIFINYKENKGKGYAVKKGIESSVGDYVLFTDADLSYGLPIISKMFEKIKDSLDIDLLFGARNHPESQNDKYGIIRKFGHLFFSNFTRRLILPDVYDTQCGIKIMSRKLANIAKEKLSIDRFAFDIELFTITRANKLKYAEFPVILAHQGETSVRIFHDTLSMMADIIRIKIKNAGGYYKTLKS